MTSADLPPQPALEASIPAFGRDGAQDRRADGRRGLWVRAVTGRWYYARFINPCHRLAGTNTVVFEPSPLGTLDKDSGIVADGETCRFASLTRSEGPPRKRARR